MATKEVLEARKKEISAKLEKRFAERQKISEKLTSWERKLEKKDQTIDKLKAKETRLQERIEKFGVVA